MGVPLKAFSKRISVTRLTKSSGNGWSRSVTTGEPEVFALR